MPKLLLIPLALLAQQDPGAAPTLADLVTDRPDFTESAITVPRGSVQLEMGATWERARGVNSASGAEVLVRWGVTDAVELRFGLPDYVRMHGDWARSDGSLGVKLAFQPVAGWDVALIETVMIEMGDSFADDPSAAELILTTGRDLGDRASFGTQLAATLGTGDPDDDFDFGTTAVLGLALTDHVSMFTELALDAFDEPERELFFHHGYSYLLSPLLQLDVHAAFGLTEAAADAQIGLGLSTRFRR